MTDEEKQELRGLSPESRAITYDALIRHAKIKQDEADKALSAAIYARERAQYLCELMQGPCLKVVK